MSGKSPQEEAASKQAILNADLSSRLSGVSLAGLEQMIGKGGTLSDLLKSTNYGQNLSSLDQSAMDSTMGMMRKQYGQAGFGASEAINYGALRGGESRMAGAGGATNSALGAAATQLGRDQFMAQQNIKFASNQAGMANYNKILNLYGQGTQTALGLASGNMQAAGSAIGGMSNASQGSSILGGAATGASLGTAIMPGWGTAIGAVVGGVGGAIAGG